MGPKKRKYISLIFVALLFGTILVSVLFLIVLKPIEKDKDSTEVNENVIQMRYDLTQCADPWDGYEVYDDERRLMKLDTENDYMEAFLKSTYNIEVISSDIYGNSADGDACEACTCLTGFYTIVEVAKGDSKRLKAINFKIIK
ncbi:hypothetical protein GF362_06855 [Candidatus Dojkabacteria bacterium]|nr:hypothetical protein [Candidatus Dojkabacteria bacterium]